MKIRVNLDTLRRQSVVALFLLGGVSTLAFAQDDRPFEWAMTPFVGVHAPELDMLNQDGLKAPMIGNGTVSRPQEGSEDTGTGVQAPFGFENELADIGINSNAGLEFQWVQSDRHVFLMGVSTWEGTSSNSTSGRLPLQGDYRDVDYDRRVHISYNEFFLGWRFQLKPISPKLRLFSRLSLNELFDVDMRDEHVFSIKGGELDDVKRIIIAKGQTTGVLMVQAGLGMEYFLKRNISLGFEGSYMFSERPFTFRDVSLDDDVKLGDDVNFVPPIRPAEEGRPLGTIAGGTDPSQDWADENVPYPEPTDMKLRFDGWKALFRVTIYY